MELSTIPELAQLQSDVHAALRAWHTSGGTPQNLLESLFMVRASRRKNDCEDNPTMWRLATNQVLESALSELEKQDRRGARILQLRFPDNNKIFVVANKLNISEHTVSRLQRKGIKKLAEVLLSLEANARETFAQAMEAQLPPPTYTRLFGPTEARETLVEQLVKKESPWVIAVVGMGGIGKTALADKVSRQIIRAFHFDSVIWLRTEQPGMNGRSHSPSFTYEKVITDLATALYPRTAAVSPDQSLVQVRHALKSRPHLIVIDNLEAKNETAYLLAHLNDLANPSKFLLTSRMHPTEQATAFTLSLDELSLEDAGALIRYHARETGVTVVASATTEDIEDIYRVTGGNPLALKLVVSLLDILPLSQILDALNRGNAGPIEDMYKYIYWQTWKVLSQDARDLLQAMPLVGESGAQPDYLQVVSRLSEAQLWPALQELRHRSLLEVRGTIQEKRYGIHRLTESFLRTEIIHWPEDEESAL